MALLIGFGAGLVMALLLVIYCLILTGLEKLKEKIQEKWEQFKDDYLW